MAPDPGLLIDAHFPSEVDGRQPAWGFSQHGGDVSYVFSSADGVLSIERTGPEPWGQAVQRVDARDLQGRSVEFSAEISGSFKEDAERQVQATGVGARVLGYPPGIPRMAGRHIMAFADGAPEIGPGTHPWTRQTLQIDVPEGATDIEVSIRLGMHGTLRARGPSLKVLDTAMPMDPEDAPATGSDPD